MDKAHCSEAYCDLHDYLINLSGICLRQDALRRSRGLDSQNPLSDGEAFGEAFQRLAEVLERWSEQPDRQPRQPGYVPPVNTERNKSRKGGTPLW